MLPAFCGDELHVFIAVPTDTVWVDTYLMIEFRNTLRGEWCAQKWRKDLVQLRGLRCTRCLDFLNLLRRALGWDRLVRTNPSFLFSERGISRYRYMTSCGFGTLRQR